MKKYSIILADPPYLWRSGKERNVRGHYKCMNTDEICALPVSELADRDCTLFLWATLPNLPNCLKVIEEWGFEYKTVAFTWIKTNKNSMGLFWGMGYYTRSNAEICLLATKGNPLPRKSHSVHSVIMSPVHEHSKKPSEVRDKIVELFGDLPRIELFSRQRVEGWDCIGYDIDGVDINEALNRIAQE